MERISVRRYVGLGLATILTFATCLPSAQALPPTVGCEQYSQDPLCDLAQRFRPYLKFSSDGGQVEPNHPSSWQWFIAKSNLVKVGEPQVLPYGQQSVESLLKVPDADIRHSDLSKDPPLRLVPRDKGGEPWESVMEGKGVYAHIENIDDDLINIEYWMLYAFNKGAVSSSKCNG